MPDRKEYLDDQEEAIKLAIEDMLAKTWKAMPCIVTSVNLAAQTIEAQPTIQAKVRNKDGVVSDVTIPLVVDCPIVWPKAGGFALTFPIAVGDEVLVIFGDRCIDGWWQSGEVSPQIETRMHSLSDGFAILAPTSQPKKLANVSSTNVQLRNSDATCIVEITSDNNVVITSSGNATVSAGTVSISAENVLNLDAPEINITGDNVTIDAGIFKLSASTIDTTEGVACLVQEVRPGDYISVDNSDRERPIVNNTAPSV